MKRFFALLLLMPLIVAAAETNSVSFDDANKLYEQKKYAEAARAYDSLISHGVISANILFNAGNAAFKSREIGRAIARYRQAESLAPRDPDIQANLRFARNTAGTDARVSPFERMALLLTLNELAVLASGALWLWFLLLALREWRTTLRPTLRGYTSLTGVTFGIFAAWLIASIVYRQTHESGVVVVNEAAARLGPLEESQVAFTIRDGSEARILAKRPGWVEIKDAKGRRGWISANSLEVVL